MALLTRLERPYARHAGVVSLLILASVGAALVIASRGPASRASIALAAAASAVGTIAVAHYLARRTALPRWAFMGAAFAMAAGAMATALAFPSPSPWTREALPLLAMQPWFFLVMSWAMPRPGAEAPAARRSLLSAAALLLALIAASAATSGPA